MNASSSQNVKTRIPLWPIGMIILVVGAVGFLYYVNLGNTIVWVDQGKIVDTSISQIHDCQLGDPAVTGSLDICIQVNSSNHGLVWAKSFDFASKLGAIVFVSENGLGNICQSNKYGEQVYCD